MLFDILDKIIPVVIIFMIFRGILTTIFGKKRRRQEPTEEYPQESADYDYDYDCEDEVEYEPNPTRKPTPAEMFEQKMRDKEASSNQKKHNGIGGPIVHDGTGILRDAAVEKDGSGILYDGGTESDGITVLKDSSMEKDGSTIRYGNDVLRDAAREKDGSIILGDKVIVPDYKPVHGDDCHIEHEKGRVYREPIGKYGDIGSVSLSRSSAPLQVEGAQKKRKRFKHASLVNGVIMEEILGKPRALKPYGEGD